MLLSIHREDCIIFLNAPSHLKTINPEIDWQNINL